MFFWNRRLNYCKSHLPTLNPSALVRYTCVHSSVSPANCRYSRNPTLYWRRKLYRCPRESDRHRPERIRSMHTPKKHFPRTLLSLIAFRSCTGKWENMCWFAAPRRVGWHLSGVLNRRERAFYDRRLVFVNPNVYRSAQTIAHIFAINPILDNFDF